LHLSPTTTAAPLSPPTPRVARRPRLWATTARDPASPSRSSI